MEFNIEELLNVMLQKGGSDLHIHAETPPTVRINNKLTAVETDVLSAEDSKKLVYALLNETEIKRLAEKRELDKGFSLEDKGRFRLNAFYHRGSVCAAIRSVPLNIPDFKTLGLPEEQMINICRSKSGLVLVTGATGVGKTTTLAAIVDRINSERYCHIITIEDPIEVVHKNKKGIITQREVGTDTLGFGDALKYVLRQDPDVILIGEMRDLETIQAALNIAETGHLVFATLHTTDCVQTINRIIDVFPGSQQPQVRTQLSYVLLSTLSQQLLPKADASGLCLSLEVMVANFGVRAMIRENKIHQIFSMIQTGQKEGMKTMNQSLFELYREGKISYQDASLHVTDIEDFKRFFKGGR